LATVAKRFNGFLADDDPLGTLAFTFECKPIPPDCRFADAFCKFDFHKHFGISARKQTPQFRQTATCLDGALQAATFWFGDVPKESEYIEQVRLT
jgi:hypothetical protein